MNDQNLLEVRHLYYSRHLGCQQNVTNVASLQTDQKHSKPCSMLDL